MTKRTTRWASAMVGLGLMWVCTACTPCDCDVPSEDAGGCVADAECKGTRICQQSACVEPASTPPTTPPTMPPTTPPARTLEDCAGTYTGSYAGALSGGIQGSMTGVGALTLLFDNGPNGTLEGNGQVGMTGQVVGSSEGFISLQGTLDLQDCSAQGTWSNTMVGSGTWTVIQQP